MTEKTYGNPNYHIDVEKNEDGTLRIVHKEGQHRKGFRNPEFEKNRLKRYHDIHTPREIVVDYGVQRNKDGKPQGGPPPEGHPRQCKGWNLKWNRRCRKWARKGLDFCPQCGRQNLSSRRGDHRNFNMSYLSKQAGPALKEALQKVKESEEERFRLTEEIDMARVLCARAVNLFEKACLGPEAESYSMKLKSAAAAQVKMQLTHVATLIKDQAKVDALRGATIPLEHVELLTERIVSLIDKHVRDVNPRVADELIEDVRDIELPRSTEGKGINITLD